MSTIHLAWLKHQQADLRAVGGQMLAASDYWSPDDKALQSYDSQGLVLGKALLNTSAAESGPLILEMPEAKLAVVANVRLDNRQQLQQALSAKPERCCDSALIGLAYQRWGQQCVTKLRGDFAFAIWDQAREHVFCARDQLGIKSLFYYVDSERVLVSNEHNALFAEGGGLTKRLRKHWLVNSLWGLGPQRLTSPCDGVELLPPAHSVTLRLGEARQHRYWRLPSRQSRAPGSDEQLLAGLRSHFLAAVKRRSQTIGPLGCELSEGLDSSGIAGAVALDADVSEVRTFSYGCQQLNPSNESVWAETYADIDAMLAMHPKLKPVWRPQPPTLPELEQDRAAFYQALGVCWPQRGGYFLRTRLAAESGCRVMLSGWGGDHCVSAPGKHYENELWRGGRWLRLYRHLQQCQRRGTSGAAVSAWIRVALICGLGPLYNRWVWSRRGFTAVLYRASKMHFLKDRAIAEFGLRQKLKRFLLSYRCFSVADYHRRELEIIAVDARLFESELVGRLFRVDYRFPMLDLELLEYAFNLPSHLKNHNGVERYAFRQTLAGLTTEKNRWRVKSEVVLPQRDPELEKQRKLAVLESIRRRWETQSDRPPALDDVVDSVRLRQCLAHPIPAHGSGFAALEQLLQFQALMPNQQKQDGDARP